MITTPKLLTRDEFRKKVFERDNHTCVLCNEPAKDAHHILERKLWPDGGYYLENGASVCEKHHLDCEMTLISVERVREMCHLSNAMPVIPLHMYTDQTYDKWGNPILSNGQRLRGELFYDENVQKILEKGKVLDLFTHYIKYPRTHHAPWSENVNSDDRIIGSLDQFEMNRVIVTEKMDGENTSLYSNYIHARSIDSKNHESRNWVKGFWSRISADIPEGWRVCGENVYAKHSIHYSDLPSYFMGFSIWNKENICLSWDETMEWFRLIDIVPVPVLYDGVFDKKKIISLWNDKEWNNSEGYVIRRADEITYGEFKSKVCKFVRKNHIQTTTHWMHGQRIVPNKLKT